MLKDLIKTNRSYRRFDESFEVKYETLLEFVDNARYTPSARNQQALMFKIITDKESRNQIFPFLKWAGYLKDWSGPTDGEKPSSYIIIGINKKRSNNYINDWTYVDLGIVAQTILLQAVEKKLGGCMIAAINRKEIQKLLNIPDYIEIMLVIAIGKPDEEVIIEEKCDLEDIKYWRENDKHFVPKRCLKDILL
jgi:nitroreductase